MIMNNFDIYDSAVYFLLIFIDGEWRFKIGKGENFFNRMKTLNSQFKVGVNYFFDENYEIPKIIPIAVFFTDSIKLTKEIETGIKYMFYKDLSGISDYQGHISREIYNINYKIYDQIMIFVNKYNKNCNIFSSNRFNFEKDNTIYYYDEEQDIGFYLDNMTIDII